MIVDVTAVPKSKRFSVSFKDGKVKLFLKSPPEQNKANIEIIKELSKTLNASVKILSGHKSKHKCLEISITEEQWKNFISNRIKKS